MTHVTSFRECGLGKDQAFDGWALAAAAMARHRGPAVSDQQAGAR